MHIHLVGQALYQRSFPSGHTQVAAAVGTYLTYLYPRCKWWWWSGAMLVGLSRIYLGVHFPADVGAGAGLGTVVTMGVVFYRQRRLACSPSQSDEGSASPHLASGHTTDAIDNADGGF